MRRFRNHNTTATTVTKRYTNNNKNKTTHRKQNKQNSQNTQQKQTSTQPKHWPRPKGHLCGCTPYAPLHFELKSWSHTEILAASPGFHEKKRVWFFFFFFVYFCLFSLSALFTFFSFFSFMCVFFRLLYFWLQKAFSFFLLACTRAAAPGLLLMLVLRVCSPH